MEFLVVILIIALVAGLILVNKGRKAPVDVEGPAQGGGSGDPFNNVQEK